jgi:methyl-accepting chemotaxis protein
MDETTQQNAALVEEAAAAAESLVDQANQLADAISQFKLEGKGFGGGHAAAHKATPNHAPAKSFASSSSPPRNSAPASRPVSEGAFGKLAPVSAPPMKSPGVSRRTGTDDEDWEEF